MNIQTQVAKAEKWIGGGMEMQQAVKKAGVSQSMLYYYRKKNKEGGITVSQFPKPRISKKAKPAPGMIVAFYGSPAQVVEAVRNVSG